MELGLAMLALLALGGFGKKKPTPSGDQQQTTPPETGGAAGDNALRQIGEVGGTVGALAGTAVGILKGAGLIGGAGTATATAGGTAAAGGGAAGTGGTAAGGGAASSGASGGATLTTATLFTGAGIGGFVVAAVVIIAVVVYEIEQAILGFNQSVLNFVREVPTVRARGVFEGFVSKFRTDSTLSGLRLDLPAEKIRQIALTALFLEYQSGKASNLALRRFYLWSGYDDQRMSRVTLQQGGDVVREVLPPADYEQRWLFWATSTLKQFTSQLFVRPLGPDGNLMPAQQGQAVIQAPVTNVAELAAAAAATLGAERVSKFVAEAEFIGYANALAWASVQGYGTFYPGDEAFAKQLAAVMVPGWPVSFKVLRTTKGETVGAWWATDPKSGASFDIADVRAWQLNVAVPT